DDNSPTKKATGGGLPVEVWTRFMKAAHQGVPVAGLQSSRGGVGNFLSGLFNGQQASNAPPPLPLQSAQAPAPPPPIPSDNGHRPQPTRASAAQPNPNARPEAASGLDGWLVDRLFGGNR